MVEVRTVDDEEDLVDPLHACSSELCCLEGGGLSEPVCQRRIPPAAAVPSGCSCWRCDALEDPSVAASGRGASRGFTAGVEHAVAGEDGEDGALGQNVAASR